MNAIAKQAAAKPEAVLKMRVGIDVTLSRKLTEAEYDRLERAGISVYGSCDGKGTRYELGCHSSAELAVAQAFLASMPA
jgi:hypothetical protein